MTRTVVLPEASYNNDGPYLSLDNNNNYLTSRIRIDAIREGYLMLGLNSLPLVHVYTILYG